MRGIYDQIRRKIRQEAPHGDRYDLWFTLLVFALAGIGIWQKNGSAAIALVTAVTASVAIYRLRTPDNTKVPAVRPSFGTLEDDNLMDFGLRNYGPGPALYLQIEAQLANSDEPLFEFGPREQPLHLSEEEFVGFIHNEQRPNDELRNAINDAEDEGKLDEMVHFYYSYVSASGIRVPDDMSYEPRRDDELILKNLREHSQNPVQMKLREIKKHCLQKTEQHTETRRN